MKKALLKISTLVPSSTLAYRANFSVESVERFKWSTGDEEYVKRRAKHLTKKGWETVKTGYLTDVDHSIGRSLAWMNSTMFTIACSHSWNQCMSYLRILFKDWLFASGKKLYITGND